MGFNVSEDEFGFDSTSMMAIWRKVEELLEYARLVVGGENR